jgi:hypothetical protein
MQKKHNQEVAKLNQEHSDELKRLDADKTKRERDHLDATRDANERNDAEMKRTIDNHRSEMRQFRDDQERKDQEHRKLIDQMNSDFAKKLRDLQENNSKETENKNNEFFRKEKQLN